MINLILALGFALVFFRASPRKSFVFLPFSLLVQWILAYLAVTVYGYYMVIWFPVGGLLGLWMRHRRDSTEQKLHF